MRLNTVIFSAILTFVLLLPGVSKGRKIGEKLRLEAKYAGSEQLIPVIIKLSDSIEPAMYKVLNKQARRRILNKALRKKAASSQKTLIQFLHNNGAFRLLPLWHINAVAAEVPAGILDELVARSDIETMSLDQTIELPQIIYEEQEITQWNISAVGAPQLWQMGYRGQNVVVASMDTGVDFDHPELSGKYRGGANSWFDPHGEHATPYDASGQASGHGTQTMGIILGGSQSGQAIGIAPDAKWIAVKIFDDAGFASLSDIHLGFQWLLDPDNDPNTLDMPDVVNNSWGMKYDINVCFNEFESDIETLKAAGIAVVCSAGNAGPGPATSISPANYPLSFAVGAVDDSNNITLFSSRGPSACNDCPDTVFPNVVAPGFTIRTTDRSFGGLPNSYVTVSGTSYASSHVSGAMALLLSAFDDQNDAGAIDEIEWVLETTALDLGPEGPDHDYGYGLIDIPKAYQLIAADMDRDQAITLIDFDKLAGQWLNDNCSEYGWCQGADINKDSTVNWLDLKMLTQYWLKGNYSCE
jgi:bacillopeptidase F